MPGLALVLLGLATTAAWFAWRITTTPAPVEQRDEP